MAPQLFFKNLLFVLNPISGDLEKENVEDFLDNYCQQENMQYHIYRTQGINDAERIRNLIMDNKPQLVIAIGGDGTVNLVATILNGGSVPMAIIPQGSGNGLSKDLNIPQDPEEALQLLCSGKIRKIDSLDINGKLSFHLGDLGFNASIVEKFNQGETRGPAAYAKIALQEYLTYEPFEYQIKTDKEEFIGKAFMVTIANANAFGSNAAINPSGIIDDGIFEICLLEPFPKTAGIGILYNLYTDSIQESVYSRILKCEHALITKAKEDVLQIDGEPIKTGTTIIIKMNKQSLPVLVPA